MVKDGRLVRYIPEEIIVLDNFLKAKKEAGANYRASDEEIESLIARLVETREDSYLRTANAVEIALGRRNAILKPPRGEGEKTSVPKKARRKIKVFGLETAAKNILDELAPIIKFMGKPPEYLKPLELLLIDYHVLANRLLAAEEKHSSVRAAVASARSSAKKMKEMEKEIKILRNFLIPAKIILRETASLRMKAAELTERSEAIKKKNGTDLISFLRALDESELLDE